MARIDLRGMKALPYEAFGEVKDAVTDSAQDLAGIARTQTAPVDKGDLRRATSAEAEFIYHQSRGGGTVIVKRVVSATEYALIQHEGDFKHPKGGQQYYLSGPLAKNYGKYSDYIGAAAKRALDKVAM